MDMPWGVVVVGTGPSGLATAIHARQRGLKALMLEGERLAESVSRFPHDMVLYSPRHEVELAAIPLVLECLRPDMAEDVELFLDEVRSAARLTHPHDTVPGIKSRCRRAGLPRGTHGFGTPRDPRGHRLMIDGRVYDADMSAGELTCQRRG